MVNIFTNKYIKKGGFVVAVIIVGFLLLGNFAKAQTYQIHEQIPGQAGKSGTINGINYGKAGVDTLQDYLESAYKFGIAIVAILAVVMIGVGGFMYIVTSAGNAGKLANAKEIITSAILGLVMALLSWLILFVINPDLVGDALKGVKIDLDRDKWVGDDEEDEACANITEGCAETERCSGNKICLKKKCMYMNDSKVKSCEVEGVYDWSGFALPGDECGIVPIKGKKLSGECTTEGIMNCTKPSAPVESGVQCLRSICCQKLKQS